MSTISATVKSIQDIMRQDAGVDGDAQRIGQLAWLFFLKIFDDREAEAELLDDDYQSPIPTDLRWRTWAAPKEGITGEALLTFVNNKLFPTLKQFAETSTTGRASVVGNVFQDAFNYMKNGTLIRQVVNKINEIDFNRSEDRHLFGDIYEQILKDLQSAGNSGEYYTPRAVTQFMIDIINPQLGEKVLDPACGTGGFLTGAIEHIRSNHVRTPDDEALLQASIRGVEKKQLPHLLCTTNMLLHGIDVPTNVVHDNTLARPLRDYASKDRVDVILTNPPFGGTEEPGIETNFPQAFRTRETADLFLMLIEHLLKTGGRAAVVLPDGTLFGDGVKARIKEKLLTDCNLHTVVRLPKGVFNPYTSIATNVLFFNKGRPTTDIWYYEHKYPVGYKSYSKTKPIRIEEFEAEKSWWNNRVESEVAWKVSIDDIRATNWNLDVPNPNKVGAEHRDPDVLLKEYEALVAEIETTRTSLRDALLAAIEDGLK
ncbi:class I SAM-dependent DNA methyltransferase [Gordonia alkanivorans]|uniref:type I restriction-modification system subunit M n=1 Tax=Gordonia alkanivorans TaxID=84096 RepID=UPI00244AF855|nr:class I SAM-dependent DNA methyltransferase [Gordonia alkanivorans]MDH3052542.1 class I SAM-dependent DNA methyltransferase [Gordonia alkanivorans]